LLIRYKFLKNVVEVVPLPSDKTRLNACVNKNTLTGIAPSTISFIRARLIGYLVLKGLMMHYRPINTIIKIQMRQHVNKIFRKKGSDQSCSICKELNELKRRL
jgi:hypothetical protein